VNRTLVAMLLAAALAGCAASPVRLYTLGTGQVRGTPSGPAAVVIVIAHVRIPDELDSEDLLVRSGAVLRRSPNGHWATRLSTEVTDRITDDLAARRPDALVTSAMPSQTPDWRVVITLSRLDVSADGHATLAADWVIVPRDPARPLGHDRAVIALDGPVATDLDVVRLEGALVDRLSGVIEVE
jgi:uncharacterized lipoprotein YmbA